jgi:hypothetical protein
VDFSIKKGNKEYMNSTFVKYLLQLKNSKQLLEIGGEAESGSDSKPEEGEINNEDL